MVGVLVDLEILPFDSLAVPQTQVCLNFDDCSEVQLDLVELEF